MASRPYQSYSPYPGQAASQPPYSGQGNYGGPPTPQGPNAYPAAPFSQSSSPYPQAQSGGYQQPPPSNGYGQPPPIPSTSRPQQAWSGVPPIYGQQQPPYPYQAGGPPPGGAPPPSGPQNVGAYRQLLQSVIQEKKLSNLYPPGNQFVEQVASKISGQIDQLCAHWRIPKEIATDFVKLALFDIVLYIDDSGSMAFEENGERIKDLKLIISRVAYAASLFDANGIDIRFMNNDLAQSNITTDGQVDQIMSQVNFRGLTPMGTNLKSKVLDPLVIQPAKAGRLTKPVLVITVTDGQPAGEAPNTVFEAVKYASRELASLPRYGSGAISFQFAQVGNDIQARNFLAKLDKDPDVGHLVDCTSNYEVEQDEMSRAVPPVNLTPELWLAKLLLGAVDSSYDTQDEQTSGRPLQGGGYGGGVPQQYPVGQASYPGGQSGFPPQQAPYGQQGGYAPQPGPYPPQGYQQPPPQGGGGYGAPPPAPRY
ncbi:MAG: hypothetical protein M1814_004188 [Vezdaea aestivalis]|nr:MAG: hypothetical protein M1814_004188 [Vezdaea aestivalis]